MLLLVCACAVVTGCGGVVRSFAEESDGEDASGSDARSDGRDTIDRSTADAATFDAQPDGLARDTSFDVTDGARDAADALRGDAAQGADTARDGDAAQGADAARDADALHDADAAIDTDGSRAVDSAVDGPDATDVQLPEAGSDAIIGPVCGNGTVEGTEQCDEGSGGNTGAYGRCNPNCTLGPRCGDSTINGPEVCDNGPNNSNTAYGGCTTACILGPRCGDGTVNGPEVCDRGPSNGTGLGACNPECSGTVQQKYIYVYPTRTAPNFGGTAGADALCAGAFGTGYRAMLADGVNRVASLSPMTGDGQVNWTLARYTQYINVDGNVVWTTDASALLGVQAGVASSLTNPIAATDDGWGSWTGLNSNWTSGDNCVHWSSNLSTDFGNSVSNIEVDVGRTFPNNGGISNCSWTRRLFCVEP